MVFFSFLAFNALFQLSAGYGFFWLFKAYKLFIYTSRLAITHLEVILISSCNKQANKIFKIVIAPFFMNFGFVLLFSSEPEESCKKCFISYRFGFMRRLCEDNIM